MSQYGPQGWWPLSLSGGDIGYHPQVYRYPVNDCQRLEISIGAILTQNTTWKNAAKALAQIGQLGTFSLKKLNAIPQTELACMIRPAGYCNQKSVYLKNLFRFLLDNPFGMLKTKPTRIVRKSLLQVKGIGRETADCILLYALQHASFVVDAYTTRILLRLKLIDDGMRYEKIKSLIESAIDQDLFLYQEYHALFVAHGKCYYSRKPYGNNDPIRSGTIG